MTTAANAVNICFERFHFWFLYYLGSEAIFLFHTVSWNLWNDHVLGWWKHKDDSNVLFLKYEDLQKVCWSWFCILSCSGLLVYSIEKHVPKHPRFIFLCFERIPGVQPVNFRAWPAEGNKVAERWGAFLSDHVPRGCDPSFGKQKELIQTSCSEPALVTVYYLWSLQFFSSLAGGIFVGYMEFYLIFIKRFSLDNQWNFRTRKNVPQQVDRISSK